MAKTQTTDIGVTDRAAGAGSDVRARPAPTPRRKWSGRRTLVFIVLASLGLWAVIIALFLRS